MLSLKGNDSQKKQNKQNKQHKQNKQNKQSKQNKENKLNKQNKQIAQGRSKQYRKHIRKLVAVGVVELLHSMPALGAPVRL